jgi:TetR/AcrR family transcriptional repressor of nem operon
MRKSKSDTVETRKRIVSKASELFQNDGITSTSIADVMSAAGLTQGGFYRHFASKDELVAEANDVAFNDLIVGLKVKIESKTPRQAIAIIVVAYLHQLQQPGELHLCPVANNGSELARSSNEVKASVTRGFNEFAILIESNARKMGIKESVEFTDYVCSTLLGAVIMAKLIPEKSRMRAVLRNAELGVIRYLDAMPVD